MCQRIDCPRCGRPTYTGCGAHVEEALKGVPKDARCACPRTSLAELLRWPWRKGRPSA